MFRVNLPRRKMKLKIMKHCVARRALCTFRNAMEMPDDRIVLRWSVMAARSAVIHTPLLPCVRPRDEIISGYLAPVSTLATSYPSCWSSLIGLGDNSSSTKNRADFAFITPPIYLPNLMLIAPESHLIRTSLQVPRRYLLHRAYLLRD